MCLELLNLILASYFSRLVIKYPFNVLFPMTDAASLFCVFTNRSSILDQA